MCSLKSAKYTSLGITMHRVCTYRIGVSFDGRNFRGFHGFKHNRESFATKQAP